MNSHIQFIVIDSFCGAGGVTQGFHTAMIDGKPCMVVVIGINHDAKAILSHAKNHPETKHFIEDFREVDVQALVPIVAAAKLKYPNAKVLFWMSAECTHHSIAAGGNSRDADSRSLPEYAYKYIEILQPDVIGVENVKEFLTWGPLIIKVVSKNGTSYCPLNKKKNATGSYSYHPVYAPDPAQKCLYYNQWVSKIKSFGYHYDYRVLDAANYGAFTSRVRYFGIFAKDASDIAFPQATHSKNGENGFEKWKQVKDVLDLSDDGESMFDRKKPIVDNTWKRVHSGLVRFVAGGKDNFILKYNSMSQLGNHVAPGTDEPCPTVAVQNRLGVCFVSKAFSGHPDSKNFPITQPAGSITTVDHHQFITIYYGKGYNRLLNEPIGPVTTKDRFSLIKTCFIDNQYGSSKPTSIDKPVGTLTTIPENCVVSCDQFLVNPQYNNTGASLEKPCFTLIATMSKRPVSIVKACNSADNLPSFIRLDGGMYIYEIYEDDSPIMVQIKEFMAMCGLVDIKMRMLKIIELLLIMGFPIDYTLIGTQADQKKFIGNAVECTQARVLDESLALQVLNNRRFKSFNTIALTGSSRRK